MKYFIAFLTIGSCFSACQKENLAYGTRITVVNGVPNQPAFALAVNETILVSAAVFGQPSYHLAVPATTKTMQWKRSTASSYDSSFVTDLPNGADFTLLFYDSAQRYKTTIIRDLWQQPASNSKSYLRLLPMLMNATNLRLTNDTGLILQSGRSFADFRNNSTVSSFSQVDTTRNNKLKLFNGAVLIDSLDGATLQGGASYTLYLFGVLGATGATKPKLLLQRHE